MRRKMVIIGAGSAVFTQGLVADLIREEDLGRWELGLVDIDSEALENVTCLANRMITAKGADIRVTASEERRDLLPGADVVVATIAVGKRRAWEADVFIPRKYGIYQPVGDTTMPGGISRAMRMIPVMVDVAEDVACLCPEAYFINYSNPMTAICRAIRRQTQIPVIGLCHGVNETEGYLARFADLPREQVTTFAVGLNHLTFILDFRFEGQDGWPILDKKLARLRNSDRAYLPESNPFSWSLYENYCAYPAVNDRHVVEFYPELFASGDYYGRQLGVDAFSFEATIAAGDKTYIEMIDQAQGKRPLKEELFHRAPGEHEQLLEILKSIYLDERKVFSVNLPNNGAVPNLPRNGLLELPAVATGRGFVPLYIDYFPDVLATKISKHVYVTEIVVEAAVTGSLPLLVEAMLADGSVSERDVAQKLAIELLKAQQDHLPQF
ncbi:MAG: hypothetical protein GX977_05975 [Firmicutes bacterium]|nr:hypothetical protein [Bacillota bacterium]